MTGVEEKNKKSENSKNYDKVKCESCGYWKRRLYDYKTKLGKEKKICQNCLMYHILYDDISDMKDESDLDVFARLNSFYSYKSNQKEQFFFRILVNYLWQLTNPNLTDIKKLWNRHYKSSKDPVEDYIKRFQEIGIIGEIKKTDDGIEIAEWGSKLNMLIHKFKEARIRNDVNSWYYNIGNIIKSAETLVGMSTELDRPTFDKNRNAIMKMFMQDCCDKDGNIKPECKLERPLIKGGFICNYYDENGNKCGMTYDSLPDIWNHLDEHDIPKEDKELYIERKKEFVGVFLSSDDFTIQGEKKTYTNWPNVINELYKSQDFFIELGKNERTNKYEWVIASNVAQAMEKAWKKTKEIIKEKKLEKIKER
ncbi:MAG: hypothetical protein ACTSPQ_09935 [Candidatus Helarchaeota archaeon]